MSQIEVPDWVLEIGADAIGRNMRNGAMTAYERLSFAEVVITAALGAWVVPVACARPHDIHEVDVGNEMAMPMWNLEYRGTTSDLTLYVLRQEKPE